jgi:hypothetical protein
MKFDKEIKEFDKEASSPRKSKPDHSVISSLSSRKEDEEEKKEDN